MKAAKPLVSNNGRPTRRIVEKIHNDFAPVDLNRAPRTCPDVSLLFPPAMHVHLVPCESQPPSSSRMWTVKPRKSYVPCFSGRKCKITEPGRGSGEVYFTGDFVPTKDSIKIVGTAKDGALEGDDFELVLSSRLKASEAFYGVRRLAMAGFLRRGVRRKDIDWSITHDAFVYKAPARQENASREFCTSFDAA